MKCFYHPQTDAIGICKNCNKGLCQECAVDIGNGIACKARCEAEVRAINEIVSRNKTVYQKTSEAYARNATTYVLIGLAFLGFGIFTVIVTPRIAPLAFLIIPFGIICLIAAGFNYSTSRKLQKK